jgi:hypothetical protein
MSEKLDDEFRETLPNRPHFHDVYDRESYLRKKETWLESQLLASREEVARLREVENAARGFLDDFDNGNDLVYADGMYHIDKLRAALSASPAPSKTCRTIQFTNNDDYCPICKMMTPHDKPENITECSRCKSYHEPVNPYQSIEEVKEETTMNKRQEEIANNQDTSLNII